ncbi:TadE/TadG family type IV pilus assembly protein [Limimaricola soesokkakensis]|uniref:TadE/TadG family type IV pilus assembly protein n=1 Tax=Limimaricola soesokkakensis TaxID=1343159 RepID=UPI003514CC5D
MSALQRLAHCEKGTAAIEFAFIAMLLFLGTIGTIEVGRALFMMNELAYAADRAARVVMLNFQISKDDLTAAVQSHDKEGKFLTGLIPENLGVDITPDPPAANGKFRAITLTYTFTPMISDFTIDSVSLTAERNIAK